MSEEQNPTVEEMEQDSAAAESASAEESSDNLSDLEQLQQKLEAAEAKAAEQLDLAVRAKAEMENIRRRAERDVQSAHKFALEGFVDSLIPALDSMEQGLAHEATNDESKAMKEGLELTLKMLLDALAKKQVEQLNPMGEVFNPEFHEAMSMQESPDHEPNTVMAVFQKGYTLNGRLIRPARVVVNKSKPTVNTKA